MLLGVTYRARDQEPAMDEYVNCARVEETRLLLSEQDSPLVRSDEVHSEQR